MPMSISYTEVFGPTCEAIQQKLVDLSEGSENTPLAARLADARRLFANFREQMGTADTAVMTMNQTLDALGTALDEVTTAYAARIMSSPTLHSTAQH